MDSGQPRTGEIQQAVVGAVVCANLPNAHAGSMMQEKKATDGTSMAYCATGGEGVRGEGVGAVAGARGKQGSWRGGRVRGRAGRPRNTGRMQARAPQMSVAHFRERFCGGSAPK